MRSTRIYNRFRQLLIPWISPHKLDYVTQPVQLHNVCFGDITTAIVMSTGLELDPSQKLVQCMNMLRFFFSALQRQSWTEGSAGSQKRENDF